jgi:phenylpropionate dioxygenase-like ring-hydroxylating dioxygenase large terminal subunit
MAATSTSWTSRNTDAVPYRVADDTAIASQRYYARDFFELEAEKLWPKVWQVACRIEELPEVGDFTEYTIVGQSILIVRVSEDSIKAYWNACRHRGVQLGRDCGRFRGGQIVCPFHGWRWNLDGSSSFVYGRQGFPDGALDPEAIRLHECRSELRWGLVWIHMDADPPPLADALAGISDAVDPIRLDLMRVNWWQYIELKANWKVAQEAFLEAYHVMQAHPEISMHRVGDDFDADCFSDYTVHPLGHGWQTPGGLVAPARGASASEWMVENDRALLEGGRTWVTERQLALEEELLGRGLSDEQFVREWMNALYADAESQGIPLPPRAPQQTGFCHIFPNTTMIANNGHALIYKFRPNGFDPESAIFDVTAVSIPPADRPEPRRPERRGPVPLEEWPFVLRQDIGNIERQQVGLRSRGFDRFNLSPRYEPMISNMHRALDRYLAG